MKIEFKNELKKFKDIKKKVGTCFKYEEDYYVVTMPPMFVEKFNATIIAFNLIDNNFLFDDDIDEEDEVRILNLKLVEE